MHSHFNAATTWLMDAVQLYDTSADATSPEQPSCGRKPNVEAAPKTETRLAHARTNRRSRVRRTWQQLLSLPGRSARRLQAHNRTRTARDASISAMARERLV
jgi:hypothetical protein